MENLNQTKASDLESLHKQFLILGSEKRKITYKLLSLLPLIYKEKVYEAKGFATIYEYAGKLAGLSHSTVEKALKLDEKLKDKPLLQKAIETQGVHKVAIIANLATPETEAMFVDKLENMSKPALQQFSKELRGKIQTSWQIEMDEEMMEIFLKLKKGLGKFGSDLSNKEAMRRLLKTMCHSRPDRESMTRSNEIPAFAGMTDKMAKNEKSQPQAKTPTKIPGDSAKRAVASGAPFREFPKKKHDVRQNERSANSSKSTKITRHVRVAKSRAVLAITNGKCSHPGCLNPAQILHHQDRFSESKNHDSIIPLCKIHHEFAHNGITESMGEADKLYQKYRQAALL